MSGGKGPAGPALAAGIAIMAALAAVAVLADTITPGDPFAPVGPGLRPPSAAHPLGTDDLGRDVLAGIVHGARTSLLVAGAVSLLVAVLGAAIGTLAAWRGGLVDDLLMRLTDFVQIVPRFFLAVVVIALLGPGLDRLVGLLGLTSWPTLARVVRAEALSLRQRPWVEAARALGATEWRLAVGQVLPQVAAPALVVLSLNAAGVILVEASLAFLGLGDPARISWGYLAGQAQPFLLVAWWMAAFPGAAIALAVLGLNLLGDGLVERLAAGGRYEAVASRSAARAAMARTPGASGQCSMGAAPRRSASVTASSHGTRAARGRP